MPASGPTRVLHAAHGLGLGGTEKTLQLFLLHLDRERFAPAAFAFEDGPRGQALRDQGIPTFVGSDFLAVLRRFDPHIVHVHRAGWPDPKLLRPIALRRRSGAPPRPLVVETNVFGRLDPSPTGQVVDLHLFVSRFCLKRYCERHGRDPADPGLGVLYNPVDTDFLGARPEREPGFVIGRVSRADPGKWSPLAWEMFPHVVRELPQARYRVVGAIPEAMDFFTAQGLSERVECLPPLRNEAELAAFLASVDLLAHANDTGESFGLTIAEAMAAGLPVVTHPCPTPRDNAQLELVEHGREGLAATNAEDYARAVVHLLRNPEIARAMGRAGQDKARRLFRVQTLVRRLESIYDQILDSVPSE